MRRSNAFPQWGVCWPGSSGGQGNNPRLSWRSGPYAPNPNTGCGGLSPTDTENNLSPTDPINPQSSGEGPTKLPNFPVVPFLVPTPMTLVCTAVVWTYGILTIPAQDVIVGGQWCRVQTLMWGTLRACPCPLLFHTCQYLCKGDPRAQMLGLIPYSSSK